MSLAANASQGPINHLANTLVRLLRDQLPVLARGAIVTAELINQVREIVRKNLNLLGSAFLTAGLITLLPSLVVTAVNVIGFTAGGVLNGSLAACIQSLLFAGQTSGWFSVLQAFGATAVISPPVVIALGTSLAVVGAGILGYKFWRWHHERRRVDQNRRNTSPDDDDDDSDTNLHGKNSNSLQVARGSESHGANLWGFSRSRP